METKSFRIKEIDIIKAIGIILMVMGHSGFPFTKFIYLFHMSIFFIVSGYCYKNNNIKTFSDYLIFLKKKFLTLWLPFILWNTTCILLNNLFLKLNIYTDNYEIYNYLSGQYVKISQYYHFSEIVKTIIYDSFLFVTNEQLAGACWFLRVLFINMVIYSFISFIANRLNKFSEFIIQFFISILLLISGYICYKRNIQILGLPKAASCYWLIFFGNFVKQFIKLPEKIPLFKSFLIFCLCFVLLLIMNTFGSISLVDNQYVNPLFFVLCSISGFITIYILSNFISNKLTFITNILIYIGRNTLPIVLFHFLSMKTVTYFVVYLENKPSFCLAAFPNLDGNHYFIWVVYSFVGVSVPLGINFFYTKITQILKKRISYNE